MSRGAGGLGKDVYQLCVISRLDHYGQLSALWIVRAALEAGGRFERSEIKGFERRDDLAAAVLEFLKPEKKEAALAGLSWARGKIIDPFVDEAMRARRAQAVELKKVRKKK